MGLLTFLALARRHRDVDLYPAIVRSFGLELDAIRFCGKAAERFSDALATCIQKIQESPTRFRQIAPNIRTCRVEKFP